MTARKDPAGQASDPGELAQVRAELAEVKAELAEQRAEMRALAALVLRIGYSRAPGSAPLYNLGDLCRFYDVPGDRDAIERIFAGGG